MSTQVERYRETLERIRKEYSPSYMRKIADQALSHPDNAAQPIQGYREAPLWAVCGDDSAMMFLNDKQGRLLGMLDKNVLAKADGDELEVFRQALSQPDIQPSGWIPVSERTPEPAQKVLAIFATGYKDVRQTSIVIYVPSKTVKAEDLWNDDSGECVEYDEADDCYYAEQGWYEESYEGETAWKLSCEVTHWMPLPNPPGINSTEDQPGPSISTEEEETE